MKELVIVKSKTINNEAIPIIIKVAEVRHGEVVDRRELSRGYVFENFESTIPLKYAKILVKQLPHEFHIDRAAEGSESKSVKKAIQISKERSSGLVCKICEQGNIKSKAGLISHIRYNHPEKFAEMYPAKAKAAKKAKSKKKVKK